MDSSQELEERERKLRLRNKVLDEIINSEKSYIEQLDMLINVRHVTHSSRSSFDCLLLLQVFVCPVREKNLISKHSFSSIFGDIEPIYSLNLALHDELHRESVGTAFFKIAPYLKLYSTYAHDYELAINALQVT